MASVLSRIGWFELSWRDCCITKWPTWRLNCLISIANLVVVKVVHNEQVRC